MKKYQIQYYHSWPIQNPSGWGDFDYKSYTTKNACNKKIKELIKEWGQRFSNMAKPENWRIVEKIENYIPYEI